MSRWCLGSIGFAYDEWEPVFYPSRLSTADRLRYYATQFSGIELDTTFYAIPPIERFLRWHDQVPEEFTFALKAPQELTHSGRDLAQSMAQWDALVEGVEALGAERCIMLLQFPPSWGVDHLDELARFLDLAPMPSRVAVEFRHASWWAGPAFQLLQSKGICWVASDLAPAHETEFVPGGPDTEYEPLPPQFTAHFSYLRLCGIHGQFPHDHTETYDPTARLQWWLSQWEPQEFNFITVGNSYSGFAIATLDRLARILGVPSRLPAQPTLF